MAVYINYIYINKYQNFLIEENNDFDLKLSDIFNTDYIKEKLKELLFQKIPAIASASFDIIKLILNILINACKSIIKKIRKNPKNVYKTITEIFNEISDVIPDIFTQNSNTVIFKLEKFFDSEIIITADSSESEMEKKILNKIKQSSQNMFEINFSEIDKINEFCKFEETKLFVIKSEENYLCLPFNDNDENKFKVIKTTSYYDAEFDISDQESENLLNIILEFKESGKKNFKIGSGDKQISVEFVKYDKNEDWLGFFSLEKKNIRIKITPDLNYLKMYSTLVHEYIHYKDIVVNKDKFTSQELNYIIKKLGQKFKKGDVVSYDEITEFLMSALLLKINNPSIVRYIVAILQKKHLIQYLQNDYTKFKFISEIPILGSNYDDFYYTDDTELNPHVSDLIHDMLIKNDKMLNGNLTEKELNLIIKNSIPIINDYGNKILDEYTKSNPNLELPDDPVELKKLVNDLTINLKNIIKEKLPAYIKNFKSNQDKFNKLKKAKKIKTQLKNKNAKEFSLSDHLLRQYVSLLIH